MAWALLAIVAGLLILVVVFKEKSALHRLVALPKAPAVLADRAREVSRALGHPQPGDSALLFISELSALRPLDPKSGLSWRSAFEKNPPISLVYRESPGSLVPRERNGQVSWTDPPFVDSGMVSIRLDPSGRLRHYKSVADPSVSPSPEAAVNWTQLFGFAGIDIATFSAAEPSFRPSTLYDSVQAWRGQSGEGLPLEVIGASYRGKPVWFRVEPRIQEATSRPAAQQAALQPPARDWKYYLNWVGWVMFVSALVALATYHYRRHRSDRIRSLRLASFIASLSLLERLFSAHHVADLYAEWAMLAEAAGAAVLRGLVVWVLYTALEPIVRRRLPRTLIGWNRIFGYRMRDLVVGREILVGSVAGLLCVVLWQWNDMMQSGSSPSSSVAGLNVSAIGGFFISLGNAIEMGFRMFAVFVLIYLLLRNRKIAAVAWVALMALESVDRSAAFLPFEYISRGLVLATLIVLLLRFGFLSFVTANFFLWSLWRSEHFPLTFDTTTWYFRESAVGLLLLFGVAAFGFYAAVQNRPLFGRPLTELFAEN